MILLNDKELNLTQFPNGETCVDGEKIFGCALAFRELNTITFKYENDSDLLKLLFVKRHLDYLKIKVNLTILYMPYSRMDRVEGDSVFTLKYVSEYINSLNFESVTVVEPHSDVTAALINNCKTVFPSVEILDEVKKEIGFNTDRDYIYFPDGGAEKRYGKMIKGYNQLVGFKHRDFKSGEITSLQVLGEPKEEGFKVIMIDDLSSYGGTFQLGAEKLRELGASEIYLVVGHAENAIYHGEMFKNDLINKVFTTNSIIDEEWNDRIKLYKLDEEGYIVR